MFRPNKKVVFFLFVMAVVVFASVACSPKNAENRRVILPGAYQFCLEHPEHEECVDG